MRARSCGFGEVAQQELRLEDPTQIPVGTVEAILGRASNQAFQRHGRGRVAAGQRVVELAHALPLFLNDLHIYRAIGSRHQVRQDAIVAVAVNPGRAAGCWTPRMRGQKRRPSMAKAAKLISV